MGFLIYFISFQTEITQNSLENITILKKNQISLLKKNDILIHTFLESFFSIQVYKKKQKTSVSQNTYTVIQVSKMSKRGYTFYILCIKLLIDTLSFLYQFSVYLQRSQTEGPARRVTSSLLPVSFIMLQYLISHLAESPRPLRQQSGLDLHLQVVR